MKKLLVLLILCLLICSFALANEDIIEEEIRQLLGEAYLIDKDYDSAVKQYREILKNKPDDVNTRVALADMLSWQEKYDQAIAEYKNALSIQPHNMEIKARLARVYLWKKDYKKVEELYQEIIRQDPENTEARILLADSYAYNKDFHKAISLYKEALSTGYDRSTKIKLAQALSWSKNYDDALRLYDQLLKEKEDSKLRLQKARILGWARRYKKSIQEYEKIIKATGDDSVTLELHAKKAYWNNRVKQAISYYKELIDKHPDNLEAMFDLSQIYSYQSMWKQAQDEYRRILDISPEHFRAKEGIEKTELITRHFFLDSGYEFFEADSNNRVNDIKKHTLFDRIAFPLDYNLRIEASHNLTHRSFSDFGDVLENEGRIGITYLQPPDWRVSGFYDFIEYTKGISTLHTFGAGFNQRIFDIGVSQLSYERKRLENSSTVIRDRLYSDNYKAGASLDIDQRLKLGLDYLYSDYSDGNSKHEPGIDVLYYLSLEPRRLTIKYGYFFRDFDNKLQAYFSPQDFSAHKITLNWRHFLNKEEIFFGADDLYYDLSYEVSVDSKDIAGHKFSAEFNWDINKRLNLNLKGSITNTSADVYEDKSATVSIKYYF